MQYRYDVVKGLYLSDLTPYVDRVDRTVFAIRMGIAAHIPTKAIADSTNDELMDMYAAAAKS